MIKAIDTYYNGNYYRSRLEARWAVFFDEFGIKYNYESEGFEIGIGYDLPDGKSSIFYLPDFYLPELDLYVEVKPKWDVWASNPNIQQDLLKFALLAAEKNGLLLLFGNPGLSTWKLAVIGKNGEGTAINCLPKIKEGSLVLEIFHNKPQLSDTKHLQKAADAANKKRFEHQHQCQSPNPKLKH